MSSTPIEQPSLSVGEVAELAGVAPSAVRFYEKHGLIVAARTSGNARRFGEEASCRIRIARVAQRVGLTVREIGEIFDQMPSDAMGEEWEGVAHALVARAERRIDQLRATLADIASGAPLCDLEPNPPRKG
ncbi:MAG: MerR family DNA-binding transcriptional regulator [Actinomycetota bacterium]|nr:MerR family DNA-binding transcriptional regulator [Actinomycetota bacterium]